MYLIIVENSVLLVADVLHTAAASQLSISWSIFARLYGHKKQDLLHS